ncbi:uncharacterized protein LOC127764118 [Oryza glaberrima]|uniref:uncharacterized protein LOC127764118 n=1 Tax=Oryza glaberrima TaxID=4538 RepID=UPI00224C1E2F|nr:uncharacterized protein LOC127764118 [Oryza glaberrima]
MAARVSSRLTIWFTADRSRERDYVKSVAEVGDLAGDAEQRRGGDELEHGEGGARVVGVKDGEGEAALDVVDERVANAGVLAAAVALHVGRPLRRPRVERPSQKPLLVGGGGAADGEDACDGVGPVLEQAVALRRQHERLPPRGEHAPGAVHRRRPHLDHPPAAAASLYSRSARAIRCFTATAASSSVPSDPPPPPSLPPAHARIQTNTFISWTISTRSCRSTSSNQTHRRLH